MKVLSGLLVLVSFFSGNQLYSQTLSASSSPKIVTESCGKPVCTWNAFGPLTYTRETGQPIISSSAFLVLNPNTQYTLHVASDGLASAVIWINGSPVFSPSDFNPGVTTLDRAITLLSDNTISVELRSKPGSSLTITVIGVDQDPPSVVETVAPPANAFGWNNTDVQAFFACTDATSGIALCPPSFILSNEGLNQMAAGTGFDNAGNSTTASLQISIDKTAPSITSSQAPAPNASGWNNSPVTVSFTCADNLSGVQSCSGPVSLSSEGKDQIATGSSADFAGNLAETSAKVSIDMTPPVLAVASPADGSTVATSSISIAGTVSDSLSGVASVQCNGIAAALSLDGFLCQVSLTPGANAIQVSAIDNAGNQAISGLTITSQTTPPVPVKAILVTPTEINLLVNQSRSVAVISDQGVPVPGAALTVSDPSIVQLDSTGQITAVRPGTAVVTATLGGFTANATVTVFSGDQLPSGTALWTLAPMPGNFAFDGAFAVAATDGAPSIYWVEAGPGFSSLIVRALSSDGRQLWSTPVTAPVVQAAAATAQVLHAGNTANTSSPAAIGAGLPPPASSQGTKSLLALQTTDALENSPRWNHLLTRITERIQSHYPSLDQLRTAALQRATARLTRIQNGFADPSLPAAANMAVAQSTVVPTALFGSYIPLKEVSDPQGGLLLLLQPLFCCNNETLVRLDPATQALSWQYADEFIGSDFAVRDDGTIFVISAHKIPDPAVSNPLFLKTSASVVALDGLTGALKASTPLATQPPDFPVACNCFQGGPLMIGPDGNAHMAYTVSSVNIVSDQNPSTETETFTMSLMTFDGEGGASSQVVQSFSGMSSFSFDSTMSEPTEDILNSVPFPVPGEIIPDGSGGLMVSWTYDRQESNDCIFFHPPDGNGGEGPLTEQCTQTSPPEVNARITDNGADHILPLATWTNEDGAIFSGNPGGTLVLGEDNTAFAFNGFKLSSFQSDTGSVAWSGAAGSHFFPSTLIGATADGGALLNLNSGRLAQYDVGGNASLSSFLFSFSDIDGLFDLLGVDSSGNAALLPPIAPLAQSQWNPRGGIAKQRTEGLLTKDVTVIGWIDGDAITFPSADNVSNTTFLALNAFCAPTLLALDEGNRSVIRSDFDRQYVNAFLLSHSKNNEPPQTLEFNSYENGGDFRAFNRVQAKLSAKGQQILRTEFLSSTALNGNTVDSCQSIFTPASKLVSEAHSDNGKKGITVAGLHVFQLNEGRVGKDGQSVNMTVNYCTSTDAAGLCNAPSSPTVPYIWSFPLFDFQAQYTVGHQIFPTYYIYENGKLVNKIAQSPLEEFIKLNSSSQIHASDIQ